MSATVIAYTIIGSKVNRADFFIHTERSVHEGCGDTGPVHALSNGGIGTRDGPARCDVCDWEGTNGDLLDLLVKLDSDDDSL